MRFIKEYQDLPDGHTQCLVEHNGNYYRISHSDDPFDTHIPETLAFRCDEEGHVDSYTECAGGPNMTREQVMEYLETVGEFTEELRDKQILNWMDNCGGPFHAIFKTLGKLAEKEGDDAIS